MNPYTHIYLYAKNHYKRVDLIDDMKILISNYANIDKKYVSIDDIINILSKLAYKHISESGNPEYFFREFVNRIAGIWLYNDIEENIKKRIIESCLSAIRFCKVKNLNLGGPDFSILPKREE